MSLPVAIIGMACRFPGIADPAALWDLLVDGREAVGEVPAARARLFERSLRGSRLAERVPWRRGGFLEGLDAFDARFFGIAPREAERVDPQQRLLLETSWEALEDAGVPATKIRGSATGVYMGIWTSDYERLMFEASVVDFYMTTGGGRSSAAGRLSYVLGLEGPSLTLDTACSSSLVAVHLACQSLAAGECELALAGGANVILEPSVTIAYGRAKMLSPDGRCKFGDAGANGYVRSEGAGVVLLKPLARALEDGDPIRAVILGSAVNHDGSTSGSIGRPAVAGQKSALEKAYARASVDPTGVRYVEAHGTGTKAGDPVEVEALASVLASGAGRSRRDPLLVGSVKSNLGHTESASGIAGLMKLVLSLEKGAIPKTLHVSEKSPAIDWERLGVALVTETAAWPRGESPRRAGLNSFGISGTNAHLVLEEAPARPLRVEPADASTMGVGARAQDPSLLPLSARSPEALDATIAAYRRFLSRTTASMAEVASAAGRGRDHHRFRAAILCRGPEEALDALDALGRAPRASRRGPGALAPKVALVFPGQGSQWIGMGRGHLEREPVFRERLEACDEAFRAHVDWSLLDVLTKDGGPLLDRIDVVQPVLFAVQVGLAGLWSHFGVRPDVVVGHSMGEVAAAHVAGCLTLEDAARIICVRSRLLRGVSGRGSMVMVELSLERARRAIEGLEDRVSVAVSNSERSTVLSGDTEALRVLASSLEAREVFCRFVKVDVASHSPQMDAVAPELLAELDGLAPRSGEVTMHSTVTGAVTEGSALDAGYWVRNLRQPVLFAGAVDDLLAAGVDVFVEVSAHPILLPAIEQARAFAHSDRERGAVALASMRREESEREVLLESAKELYVRGASLDWHALYPETSTPTAVRLPHYPWQRKRFWLELGERPDPLELSATRETEHETDPGEPGLFYRVAWELEERPPSTAEAEAEAPRRFVLFDDDSDVAEALGARLVSRGERVARIARGESGSEEAVARRLDAIAAESADGGRLELVHLGGLGSGTKAGSGAEPSLDSPGIDGFLSLVLAAATRSHETAVRLCVVSSNAHAVSNGPGAPSSAPPSRADVWPLLGISRVAAREYPELEVSRIDLGATDGPAIDALVSEVCSRERDDDVALRGSSRFVARLAPVDLRLPTEERLPRLEPGAYLVTGGMGGLGLRVARLLVDSGACRLGLMGRSAPSPDVEREIERFRGRGVDVVVLRGDVTARANVERALGRLREGDVPLRGIVHAAGILEDGILSGLDGESLRRVMAPKLAGASHLSSASWRDPLDFFVLFSSVVSLFGTSGQGSYAAANAFLDGLAHERKTRGRPALAIHWAPWAEVGLAARLGGSAYMERRGIGTLTPSEASRALGALLGRPDLTEVAVMPFDVGEWASAHPVRSGSTFLTRVLAAKADSDEEEASAPATLRAALEAPPMRSDRLGRRAVVEARLREEVANVTRMELSEIEDDTPFKSMGLDSLMGLELRNRLERAAALRLSATVVWSYPTVERLTSYLLERLDANGGGASVPRSEPARDPDTAEDGAGLVALLEGMGELGIDDVDRMLAERRESNGSESESGAKAKSPKTKAKARR